MPPRGKRSSDHQAAPVKKTPGTRKKPIDQMCVVGQGKGKGAYPGPKRAPITSKKGNLMRKEQVALLEKRKRKWGRWPQPQRGGGGTDVFKKKG